jgi:hypothetical protein
MRSVFADAKQRQEIQEIEFRYFRNRVSEEIPAICQSIERFDALRREFPFRIDKSNGEDHLQINFGKRKMGINDLDGKPAIEKGPSLVYTVGPTNGVVSTVLYPASSTLGGVEEDHIFLRIGSYSAHELLSRLRSDMKDLVSYAFISSIETDPSIRDRIRFWWLRSTHPHSKEKKFVRPLTPGRLLTSASRFTMMSLVIALLRPLGLVFAYLLLIYLGFANLAQHLR